MKEFLKAILMVVLVLGYKAFFIFAGAKILVYGVLITFNFEMSLKGLLFILFALCLLKHELWDTNVTRSLD